MLRQGGTLAEAGTRAYAMLDGLLQQQSSMLAFEKVFLIMGVTFAFTLPLLLLFRSTRLKGGGGVAQ